MKIIYHPNKQTVEKAMQVDDPLLALIKHDLSELLLSNIDDGGEHIILLRLLNRSEYDLDKYYRVIINSDGADWTFVCPSDYKGISNREKRMERFYNDGIKTIRKALDEINIKM